MPLDAAKILSDLQAAAKPELEARAKELRTLFLKEIDDFVDSSRIGALDDLLKKAAQYEIDAITSSDRDKASQYASAAEDVLRQIKLIVISEQIVASHEAAALVQAAALAAWGGFKSVATSMLGIAVKGIVSGALGPAGGMLADAAGAFLDGASDDEGSDS